VEFDQLQALRQFHVRQKLTMMANRYVVTAANQDGSEGEVVGFAQQKRMAFREQVTIYTDESKRAVLCSFKARSVMDLGAVYDVTGAHGEPVGLFRKSFGASLLRSTWRLEQPGRPEAVGRERSMFVALFRRAWDFIPFTDWIPFAIPYHFDFVTGSQPVMSVTKKISLHDRYVVDVPVEGLDRRLAIAQAVALDALQSR
jgi:uncharacterized protein YxjI